MSETENSVATPKKKNKVKYIWIALAVFVAVIAAAVVTVVCMLFSFPVPRQAAQPTAIDIYHQSRTINRVVRQARKNPDKLNSMRLKEDEVNSAIRCAAYYQANFSGKKQVLKFSDMDLVYRNGVFSGVIPYDTGLRFLHGGVIEMRYTAKISKVPGKVNVDVLTAKAGKISLPVSKVNEIVRDTLQGSRMKKKLDLLDMIVEEISVEPDGRLKLTYYPRNFVNALIYR